METTVCLFSAEGIRAPSTAEASSRLKHHRIQMPGLVAMVNDADLKK